MNDSIQDTLWMRAFYLVMADVTAKGEAVVEFDDVDTKVVELSKLPIDKLREVLFHD